MFIATVHKAERKTVVESALVSSMIGIQSEGFSSDFLPLPWGPVDRVPAPVLLGLEVVSGVVGAVTSLDISSAETTKILQFT